jgi:hypothetical protein
LSRGKVTVSAQVRPLKIRLGWVVGHPREKVGTPFLRPRTLWGGVGDASEILFLSPVPSHQAPGPGTLSCHVLLQGE